MNRPKLISYALIALTLLLVGWLKLTLPLLTVLFSLLVLNLLRMRTRARWAPILGFVVLLAGIGYGLVFFLREAVEALPKIAETSIPLVIQYAEDQGMELPFTDLQSLKELALNSVKTHMKQVTSFGVLATKFTAWFLIGAVAAVSLFLNSKLDLERDQHAVRNNLYSLVCEELSLRWERFYGSFATVMGAQLLISAINTALTSAFILWADLPYAPLVICLTFLSGLLPIIGNLLSNTLITGVAFTISPKMALMALGFLILIHKLEYFLNSKIIGDRIKNPVWLTLLALIAGERLMGVPGMILAPVILHYLKTEAARVEVQPDGPPLAVVPPPPDAEPGKRVKDAP
jgi:predicted PurR-regulated permease PerM